MSKKVRQTITIDVDRLENAFNWHLNLDGALQKLAELDEIRNLSKAEILELIKECRLRLTSMDMTLSEFQEIYEVLTGDQPDSAPPPEPELLQEDIEKQMKDRMIGNLLSGLDKTKK